MDTANQESEPRRGGLFKFPGEVRAEARKVTWATRSETIVSTVMVLMMAVAASIFFFLVDFIAGYLIRLILNIRLG